VLTWQARYAEAAEAFEAMRATAEALGDRLAQALGWRRLASTKMDQGDFRAALDDIARAEDIVRAEGAQQELPRVLSSKGQSLYALGDLEGALALGEQALALSEERDDLAKIADSLNLLAAIRATLGRFDQAVQDVGRALKLYQDLGDRAMVMRLTNNLGIVAGYRGDYRGAFERYQEALAIAREIGHRNVEMLILRNVGEARIRLGEYAAAEADLRQLIHMAETVRFGELSFTYGFLAEAYLGQGKATEALEAAQRSLALGQETGSQESIATAWRVLGRIAAALNKPIVVENTQGRLREADARTCFAESARICTETGMEDARARTLRAWAEYELSSGDRSRGEAFWEEARGIFTQIGAQREAESMTAMPAEINSSTK
jgi:tetratricopeptide (TPR) repeat protein